MQLDSYHHSWASNSFFREDLPKAYDKGILPIYFFYLDNNITSKMFTTNNLLEEL